VHFSHSRIVSRRNALACRPVTTVSRLSPVRLSLGRPIILLPGGTSKRAAERCWPTEFNGFPGREVGRARALENDAGAKIGAIGRTLPEYFTDDPVMVKPRRYPWPRYKKTRGRRSEALSAAGVSNTSFFTFISRARAPGERSTLPRLPIQTMASLHSRCTQNSPDE